MNAKYHRLIVLPESKRHISPDSFVNENSEERPGVEAEINRGGESMVCFPS